MQDGKSFYSNGKLLLTGEYAVLDGALSLAVPTSRGQSLSVEEIDVPELRWTSFDEKGKVWFESSFDIALPELGQLNSENDISRLTDIDEESNYKRHGSQHVSGNPNDISKTLSNILREAKNLNPNFLSDDKGFQVETKLDFPRDWGLGSSSTLINNIAQWAGVDAYQLLKNTFSGSGYDVACAQHDHPILYRLEIELQEIDFHPSFQDQIYFVHLNRKQNSRKGIAKYRQQNFDKSALVKSISKITRNIVSAKSLEEFEFLLVEHEMLISKILGIPTVKETLFSDFQGTLKSLGAWGGDFILATGNEEVPSYFVKKGYRTVIPYSKMILRTEN